MTKFLAVIRELRNIDIDIKCPLNILTKQEAHTFQRSGQEVSSVAKCLPALLEDAFGFGGKRSQSRVL